MIKKKLNVCLTSDQIKKYDFKNSIVVVIDILRATSVISTAFHYGINSVRPVKSIKEAIKYKKKKNFICAGERNAIAVKELDYGNSPFQYMNNEIRDKKLVITTTNGTNAIQKSKFADEVITASYINLYACCDYLLKKNKNIIFLCSGWKGFFNLEDCLFAGKICKLILNNDNFFHDCDSLRLSLHLENISGNNKYLFLKDSSHRNRLKSHKMDKDTKFCLNPTFESEIVPKLKGNCLYDSNYIR